MTDVTTADERPAARTRGKALHRTLWVVQVLLFAAFAMAGSQKLLLPIGALAPNMPWVLTMPEAIVRFIGLSELLGAIGILLPALTRVKPWLTPLAAAGLALVMLLAVLFHLARGEAAMLAPSLVLGSLAAFVAWGRTRRAPIAPRRAAGAQEA